MLLVAGALTAGCSKGDSAAAAASAAAAGNPAKFCELSAKLDAASQDVLSKATDATDEKTAIKQFLEDQKGMIAELRNAAPADLRDDFDVSMSELTATANGETAPPSAKLDAANKTMSDYDSANCNK
ncbi:MAG: hypothetical protein JWM93_3436 [Frankiales bacterium]|nr:hypothetical protein [Frankiales bacterium]